MLGIYIAFTIVELKKIDDRPAFQPQKSPINLFPVGLQSHFGRKKTEEMNQRRKAVLPPHPARPRGEEGR